MGAERKKTGSGFTVLQNDCLRDKELSLKAKGLFALIVSLPPDWVFSVRGLAAICKEGPDSIRAGLKELEEYGYLKRETSRDKAGTFRTSYTKRMEPVGETSVGGENPDRWGKHPPVGVIQAGLSRPENPTQINIDTKERYIGGADAPTPKRQTKFIPPTVEEVEAYCKEKGYQLDAARFVDFYTAGGWMRGKTKIKDWKACVRTWRKNEGGRPQKPKPTLLTADNFED